ncbi:MMPL family transporter [Nocardioides anomalus]|uniref:MMPL family transporter n=1 Tax=Nocardioides anomalus TaxID=2712223 RepID=A0A6G6WIQ2_9ACTN|nr:MMPL family transporter [Nocardioides anomalus]QIG45023.1 MMPL family transporter [Nocardioides anomalus]
MFGALGRLASRRPWFVIAAWVVIYVLVVALAPKFESTQDQADFLPRHYESIKAAELQADEFPSEDTTGAIVVFDRKDGEKLSEADTAEIQQVVDGLDGKLGKAFTGIQATPPSENGLVQIAVVGLSDDVTGYDDASFDSVEKLREDLTDAVTGDLQYGVTGQVAQGYDQQESGNNALLIVGVATVVLIVLLLAIIFRSVLICLLPIVTVGAILTPISMGLIATANKLFDLKASTDVETILVVVLYGIGTDYLLFFLFRYRERLREGEEKREAVAHALERAGEAIASAGGAVIVAFMALILSSLGIFRSLGPALAIAVAVTLLAALTLIPALATLLGRALFWPSKKYLVEPKSARFEAVGRSLGRHPGRYAIASGGVLALLALAALTFNPTFDLGSSGTSDTAESAVALKTLEKGYPAGATDPTVVLLHSTDDQPLGQDAMTEFGTALSAAKGVAQVGPPTPSKSGTTASYSVFLNGDPASDASIADVKGPIRTAAHDAAPDGTEALVGGTTSIFVDFQAAMNRDYSVVFPVAALIIAVILALLLRSLVAPWYLMASVGLGFGATLGATSLVFQNLLGDSGLIFLLPIYIYLFVVALGTDYNILMVARLREEAREGLDSRNAAAEAVKHAGPTIAAAGVILAGTFGSLMLAGNSLLSSMGFALSFGIIVSAFVTSMFFTPALTALIGRAAWWPGHGDEKREAAPAEV